MADLFVYGSLMYPQVWSSLIAGTHRTEEARLDGYERFIVTGQTYPGLKPQENHQVKGQVLFDLNQHAIKRLDHFEGHYYQRQTISVTLNNNETLACETYLFKPRYYHLLSSRTWSAEEFERRHLKTFLHQYSY